MQVRLQKAMAQAGIASRRASEQLILAGRVMVNGKVVKKLGTKVDPVRDVIKVDQKKIDQKESFVYYMLHKPRGYLSTVADDRGRKTVMDLLAPIKERIYPVGRLDYNSEGLLLLTNDGTLANRLMHPRYQIQKFYLVEVIGIVTPKTLATLRSGVKLEDGITARASVELLTTTQRKSTVKIGIHEGRNRQVRRMFAACDHKVIRLIRTQVGSIRLGNLAEGTYRKLTPQELGKLKAAVKYGK